MVYSVVLYPDESLVISADIDSCVMVSVLYMKTSRE